MSECEGPAAAARQRSPYRGKGPDALPRVLSGTLSKRIHVTRRFNRDDQSSIV